jgi:hypothetical protein
MPILTYKDIVLLTQNVNTLSFSKDDYESIVLSCRQDRVLSNLLAAYPPENFKLLYLRAREQFVLAQQDRQHLLNQQEMMNVHDPIFHDILITD